MGRVVGGAGGGWDGRLTPAPPSTPTAAHPHPLPPLHPSLSGQAAGPHDARPGRPRGAAGRRAGPGPGVGRVPGHRGRGQHTGTTGWAWGGGGRRRGMLALASPDPGVPPLAPTPWPPPPPPGPSSQVLKVNGAPIDHLAGLVAAVEGCGDEFVRFDLEHDQAWRPWRVLGPGVCERTSRRPLHSAHFRPLSSRPPTPTHSSSSWRRRSPAGRRPPSWTPTASRTTARPACAHVQAVGVGVAAAAAAAARRAVDGRPRRRGRAGPRAPRGEGTFQLSAHPGTRGRLACAPRMNGPRFVALRVLACLCNPGGIPGSEQKKSSMIHARRLERHARRPERNARRPERRLGGRPNPAGSRQQPHPSSVTPASPTLLQHMLCPHTAPERAKTLRR